MYLFLFKMFFFIHFVNADRKKLYNSFQHSDSVYSISLQPGNEGNIFATACGDGILRLFDTRRNKKGEFDKSLKTAA